MPSGIAIHIVLELLAYTVGAQLYYRQRRQHRALVKPDVLQSWAIIAGVVFGAACGSKLLYVLQYWQALQTQPALVWWSGKTIVGGLLGGWLGVELAKRAVQWQHSTGDLFVWPLIVGMSIGRMGCQFAGLQDLTYGGVTTLPWGWNYGDGLKRHPTSLYEIVGLLALAWLIHSYRERLDKVSGDRFKAFILGYLLLRTGLEFLKPPHTQMAPGLLAPSLYGSLSSIQWACVIGLVCCIPTLRRWWQHRIEVEAR